MSVKTDHPAPKSAFDSKAIRYGLEGALLGVAIVGIATWASGVHSDTIRHDLIGAVIGFAAVSLTRYLFLFSK